MKFRITLGAMLAALFALAVLSAPQPAAASGPAMALGATGNVLCDDPIRPTRCTAEFDADNPAAAQFTITVDATVIPQGGYAGFASEVVFDGLTYTQRAACTDEVVWPDLTADPCLRFIGLAGQSQHGASTGIIPPFAKSNHSGTLVELDVHCADEGTSEVLLTALPVAPFGAGYVGLDGVPVLLKTLETRNLDLRGDTTPDAEQEDTDGDFVPDTDSIDPKTGERILLDYGIADTLRIECAAGPLPTPTPCPPQGCPTATNTPTPTVTITPTPRLTPTPCPTQGCALFLSDDSLSPPIRPPAPEQLSPPLSRDGPLAVGSGLPIAGSSAVAGGDGWLLIAILASMALAALIAGAGAALYLRDKR